MAKNENPHNARKTTPAQSRAAIEGEQRRLAYLATLDPRQREDLDPE